jgi:hypothetical protein
MRDFREQHPTSPASNLLPAKIAERTEQRAGVVALAVQDFGPR